MASSAMPSIFLLRRRLYFSTKYRVSMGMSAAALAQRGQPDGHHRQPVVEVLAEAPGLDLRLEIPVGGGDQAHVHAGRLDAAHALELALLERAQQLHLHLHGDLADLVQEEGAAVGQLEAAGLGGDSAGEGAALVAEQLALDQVVREWPRS